VGSSIGHLVQLLEYINETAHSTLNRGDLAFLQQKEPSNALDSLMESRAVDMVPQKRNPSFLTAYSVCSEFDVKPTATYMYHLLTISNSFFS
jgi:hypothetical protein